MKISIAPLNCKKRIHHIFAFSMGLHNYFKNAYNIENIYNQYFFNNLSCNIRLKDSVLIRKNIIYFFFLLSGNFNKSKHFFFVFMKIV